MTQLECPICHRLLAKARFSRVARRSGSCLRTTSEPMNVAHGNHSTIPAIAQFLVMTVLYPSPPASATTARRAHSARRALIQMSPLT